MLLSILTRKLQHSASFQVRTLCRTCAFRQHDSESATSENHSSDEKPHSKAERKHNDVKHDILEASLQFVPTHGWTPEALAEGARSLDLPLTAHGLFPSGGVELVNHFYIKANKQTAQQLQTELERDKELELEKKPTPKILRDGVVLRLGHIIPYIDSWPQAMGLLSLPPNIPTSLNNLTKLVDELWFIAGDRSTDFNWYTKRAMLAAVYKSSELYLLQDKSADYQETWRFVERRLADVATIGKGIRQLQDSNNSVSEGASTAFTLARNMLGYNSRHR